jgi:hypothetical protein
LSNLRLVAVPDAIEVFWVVPAVAVYETDPTVLPLDAGEASLVTLLFAAEVAVKSAAAPAVFGTVPGLQLVPVFQLPPPVGTQTFPRVV